MDNEQQKKISILSFLKRCQNGSSETLNIAKYLGLRSAKEVLPLLRRMQSEGTVTTTTGYQWQVSRAGSPPNCVCGSGGDTEVFLPAAPAASANRPPRSTRFYRRNRSAGQLEKTDVDRSNFGLQGNLRCPQNKVDAALTER